MSGRARILVKGVKIFYFFLMNEKKKKKIKVEQNWLKILKNITSRIDKQFNKI
jgi:hypothetical protein